MAVTIKKAPEPTPPEKIDFDRHRYCSVTGTHLKQCAREDCAPEQGCHVLCNCVSLIQEYPPGSGIKWEWSWEEDAGVSGAYLLVGRVTKREL
jgi:hypothetical protein